VVLLVLLFVRLAHVTTNPEEVIIPQLIQKPIAVINSMRICRNTETDHHRDEVVRMQKLLARNGVYAAT